MNNWSDTVNAKGCRMIKKASLRNAEAQTDIMPAIAIEEHHLDVLNGPIVVSPLNLTLSSFGNIRPGMGVDASQYEQCPSRSSQTNLKEFATPAGVMESKETQTDFTSFTRPTHYFFWSDLFDRYLILDSSKPLLSTETKSKAEMFNKDFFTRFGNLFPMKFITTYFYTKFKPSKL